MGRSRFWRPVAMLGAFVALATFIFSYASTTPAHAVGNPAGEQAKHAQMIADMFDAHNAVRRKQGLPAFVFSPDISLRVSQPFTNQMSSANNGTIWHNTSTGISKGGSGWAENVAGGWQGETAQGLVQRWMDSSGHRTNILNRSYTTIAIGYSTPDKGDWTFATVNLYAKPTSPGPTYATGAAWLASRAKPDSNVNVYLTPGTHNVNGRQWRTVCEPYSQTKRCRTEIWATQTTYSGGRFTVSNGWVFNNLTYAPSQRSIWKGNPLAGNGVVGGKVAWVDGGRKWRTECDTATTGRGGCRTYTTATVVRSSGNSHKLVETEIFNNMVLFG